MTSVTHSAVKLEKVISPIEVDVLANETIQVPNKRYEKAQK